MAPVSSSRLYTIGLFLFAALLDGCSAAALQPSLLPPTQSHSETKRVYSHVQSAASGGYVYVSNRTKHGQSELLVYRAGSQDPSPIQTITQGLVDAGGVAADSTGNVYVANGAGGNVLEFSPGGAALIFTYSAGLIHPIAVTVNDTTLYVTDQGTAGYGAQQVFEYTIGNGTPAVAIAGYGAPPELNEGIAIDYAGSQGAFFVTASAGAVIPPTRQCSNANDYPLGEDLFPTLWQSLSLSNTVQPSGLAFDSADKLYVADLCSSDVAIYSFVKYTWTYAGNVSGTFDLPLFLTIDSDVLAIPSYGGNAGAPGRVNVIDLSGKTANETITKGLQHPVGAAAFYPKPQAATKTHSQVNAAA